VYWVDSIATEYRRWRLLLTIPTGAVSTVDVVIACDPLR